MARRRSHIALSVRADQALAFIAQQQQATGVCPSMQEVAAAMGVKSRTGAHSAIHHLIGCGRLRQLGGGKWRALEVIPEPSPRNARVVPRLPLSYPSPNAQFFRVERQLVAYSVERAEEEAVLVPMEGKR